MGISWALSIAYHQAMSRDETSGQRAAVLRLGHLPGYVRQPNVERRLVDKDQSYKKGWEVRFTARTEEQIEQIRELIVAAGFVPARPFLKGQQFIQPVYGMEAVQAYLEARQIADDTLASAAKARRTTVPQQPTAQRSSVGEQSAQPVGRTS